VVIKRSVLFHRIERVDNAEPFWAASRSREKFKK
jgi:hypothetical protein